MNSVSRILIFAGVVFIATGIIFQFLPKIPWLGRLPGDICIKKESFSFYFPISTCIIVSIILSFIFYLFGKR